MAITVPGFSKRSLCCSPWLCHSASFISLSQSCSSERLTVHGQLVDERRWRLRLRGHRVWVSYLCLIQYFTWRWQFGAWRGPVASLDVSKAVSVSLLSLKHARASQARTRLSGWKELWKPLSCSRSETQRTEELSGSTSHAQALPAFQNDLYQ